MSEATTTKFYHAQRANIKKGGIQFEATDDLGGVLWGVWATSDPKEMEALDALVADPRSGVYAITETEYNAKAQKKMNGSTGFQPRPAVLPQPPAQPGLPTAVASDAKPAGNNPVPAVAPEAGGDAAPLDEKAVEVALAPQPVAPSPTAPTRASRRHVAPKPSGPDEAPPAVPAATT